MNHRVAALLRRGKATLRNLKGLTRRCHPAAITGRVRRERVRSFEHLFNRGPTARRHAMRDRLATLLAALGAPPPRYPADPSAALAEALADAGPDEVWLALAVLSGRLPDSPAVMRTVRCLRLDGPAAALFWSLKASGALDRPPWPEVDVAHDGVLVDVSNTSRIPLTTGIQRVVRESVQRWDRDHAPTLVGWTQGFQTLRRLNAAERDAALNGFREGSAPAGPRLDNPPAIVPWGCVFLVPELPAEPDRTRILQALASFSRSRTGLIGYDCVPMTNAETVDEGMAGNFARFLAAAAHMDRITTISHSSEAEFRGWKAMLAGSGRPGPDIRTISLPVEVRKPTEAALEEARVLLSLGPLPIVLAVGSHEPRKNHLAVLHAAELLWREGLLFSLTFVGAHRWSSDQFHARIEHLQSLNRPVQAIRALPDGLLWAAYQVADITVFPSIHEGFGLPVAESLASGTPVITSNFGSMKEIAGAGGALLVDPRDDRAIEAALRSLLEDLDLRARLASEAQDLPQRTWEQYAAEVWRYLVEEPAKEAL